MKARTAKESPNEMGLDKARAHLASQQCPQMKETSDVAESEGEDARNQLGDFKRSGCAQKNTYDDCVGATDIQLIRETEVAHDFEQRKSLVLFADQHQAVLEVSDRLHRLEVEDHSAVGGPMMVFVAKHSGRGP